MGPKLRGAPPAGETEIQKFMREMHEQDEDRATALEVRDQAAAALLAGVQAAHAAELAEVRGQLNAMVNGAAAAAAAAAAAGAAPGADADAGAGGEGEEDEPDVEGLGGAAGSGAATVYSPAGSRASSPAASFHSARASEDDNPFAEVAPWQLSRNYQAFLRQNNVLAFSGEGKDEVLDWVKRFEQGGVASCVTSAEVVAGLSQFLKGHARTVFNEQETLNAETRTVWTWPAWRSWIVNKFNPEEKVMCKMQEYRSLVQGRRTVDEYYADFLELRNYCASKGSDREQKVQFLAGLNPELKLEVQKALLQSPKATLDQAVELARSLYSLAPKSQPVRGVTGSWS